MADSIEKLLADVQAQFKTVGDEVKQTAETALQQAKDTGTVADEVKAKADKLLTEQTAISAAMEALETKVEGMDTAQADLEQRVVSRGGGSAKAIRSFGEQVINSEDLKSFVSNGARGTQKITVQAAITSIATSAGGLIWTDQEREVVGIPRRTMTIRDLLMPGSTTSNLVEYAQMTTRDNNAATVAEGAQKPESNYEWGRADAPVRTIAHWVHVSRQAMDDAAQLQGEIDGELRYGLMLEEENQILAGDGLGENLSGLLTEATAYAAPAGSVVVSETPIDRLRLAMLQVALTDYMADGVVMHPTDWTNIELQKDTTKSYLFANPRALSGPTLWGNPVVPTQAVSQNEFLTGAFRMAATIYDRMETEVLISSEDRDNFIKNMLTVRAEKRLALAVKRPAALVTGDFTIV